MATINLRDGFGAMTIRVVQEGSSVRCPATNTTARVTDKNAVAILGFLYVTEVGYRALKANLQLE